MKDGGPAFPQISELGDVAATSKGMSHRDYLAAKAMEGMLAYNGFVGEYPQERAIQAYEQADEMLRAKHYRKTKYSANINLTVGELSLLHYALKRMDQDYGSVAKDLAKRLATIVNDREKEWEELD